MRFDKAAHDAQDVALVADRIELGDLTDVAREVDHAGLFRSKDAARAHRLVRYDPVEPGLPQRIDGLLPRRCGLGSRLRDRGRARLLQWAFGTLDLNRVQAETDTRNTASARVLEKLGFVREGTLREDCVVGGEVLDSWVYGLIRREGEPAAP